jgi:hypothetical protein
MATGVRVGVFLAVAAMVAMTQANALPSARFAAAASGPRLSVDTVIHDVGINPWAPAPDVYLSVVDSLFPSCIIENLGTQSETNVSVTFVIYDTAAGTLVYRQIVNVDVIDSGAVDTVAFPGVRLSAVSKVFLDTMSVALIGDEEPRNDRKPGRITIVDWPPGRLSYHDGTFEDGYSFILAGNQFAELFPVPHPPVTITRVLLWLMGPQEADYDAEVRIYRNDGTPPGYPGTRLGTWTGKLHADPWLFCHMNEIEFDPPITVDYDSFFVSYYQTSISPNYPYLAMDTTAPSVGGNDWEQWDGTWGTFSLDNIGDFGIDVCVGAAGIAGEGTSGPHPSFVVAPNPVGRSATMRYVLRGAGLASLNVCDVTGRTILSRLLAGRTGSSNLDLRTLEAGVYLVKVTAGTYSTTQKLVVER